MHVSNSDTFVVWTKAKVTFKATDTRAIFFSRRQRNGDKLLRYRREEKIACVSCLATATESFSQSLQKVQNIELSATIATRHDRRAISSSRR